MGAHDESSADGPRSPQAFAAALTALKQEGAAVLVVGDVPDSVGRVARDRLFGDRTTPPRHRIAISTTSSLTPAAFAFDTENLRHWTHVAYTTSNRATAARPGRSTDGPRFDRECDSLAELGVAITDTIAALERETGGLAPAQLRVGFDSLRPLVEAGEAEAFRFLHLLVGRLKAVQGMLHVPLLDPITSRPVRTFTPLFDALIELRVSDGRPHQRWHFPSQNLSSAWLEL